MYYVIQKIHSSPTFVKTYITAIVKNKEKAEEIFQDTWQQECMQVDDYISKQKRNYKGTIIQKEMRRDIFITEVNEE